MKVLDTDQISNFWGNLRASYNAVNVAGKFSNSKLAHAANFEAPYLGGVAIYNGETADFYQTHRPLTHSGRGTDSYHWKCWLFGIARGLHNPKPPSYGTGLTPVAVVFADVNPSYPTDPSGRAAFCIVVSIINRQATDCNWFELPLFYILGKRKLTRIGLYSQRMHVGPRIQCNTIRIWSLWLEWRS